MRGWASSLVAMGPVLLLGALGCSSPKEATKRGNTDTDMTDTGGADGAGGSTGAGGTESTGGASGSGGSEIGMGGSTGFDAGPASDGGIEVCAGSKQSTKPKPVDIYIMLDKSGSMQGSG